MTDHPHSSPQAKTRLLPTSSIQKDGQTQHRLKIDSDLIAEYAALMSEGVEFPAVRVWWDGKKYWLSDGFQRLAAAEHVGITEISAEVLCGTLADAMWDSYAANALHGARRSREETRLIVHRALQHPNAASLSNMHIAKHLRISEATVRRLRQQLSSSIDEDSIRVVTRNRSTYSIRTANIGKACSEKRAKTRAELRNGLSQLKKRGSGNSRCLFAAVEQWAFGPSSADDCLLAVERILGDHRAKAANG